MEATTTSDNGQTPWEAHEAAETLDPHPEIPVLAALAGGFILAKVLKALGSDE